MWDDAGRRTALHLLHALRCTLRRVIIWCGSAGDGQYYRVVGDEINHNHSHQNYDYH
jgi:hypothetical protein